MNVKKVIMRLTPAYERFRAMAERFPGLSSASPAKPAVPPTPPQPQRGNIRAEDLADTPLYRAYLENNGGRSLPCFNAEVTWSDKLPGDVLVKQLGQPFAALNDDALVLLRIRSKYEGSREILVLFDQKRKLAPLVEDFIEKRVGLTPLSYDSFFLLQIEAERVHLEMAANLNPYVMRKGLMLETLDLLLRRHFPGYTITTDAVNLKVIKWIAERYRAELLVADPSQSVAVAALPKFDRLILSLEEAGAILPEDATAILEAESIGLAFCLLNTALLKQESGLSPLEHLIFLIEKIPIPLQDQPQLAIQGKIPVS